MATLRQQAQEAQAKAARKLQRLRRKGVDTSSIDPRRDLTGLSSAQLRRHIDRVQSFNANRGYVAGVNGQPINRAAFDVLKAQERRLNRVSEEYHNAVGNIVIPELGRDVRSVVKDREDNPFRAGGEQATFERRNRRAQDINGQSAIVRLIEDMRDKLSPSYLNKRMADMRGNLETMLRTTNDDAALAMVQELTDHQLNVLVDYNPEFMRAVGGRYEYVKAMNTQEQFEPENWMSEVFDQNFDAIHEMLTWARDELPRSATGNNDKRSRKNRRKP